MGSTLMGKNLLLQEQILFLKSGPPFKTEAKMKIGRIISLECISLYLNDSNW